MIKNLSKEKEDLYKATKNLVIRLYEYYDHDLYYYARKHFDRIDEESDYETILWTYQLVWRMTEENEEKEEYTQLWCW